MNVCRSYWGREDKNEREFGFIALGLVETYIEKTEKGNAMMMQLFTLKR